MSAEKTAGVASGVSLTVTMIAAWWRLLEFDDVVPARPVVVDRGIADEFCVAADFRKPRFPFFAEFVRVQCQTDFPFRFWAEGIARIQRLLSVLSGHFGSMVMQGLSSMPGGEWRLWPMASYCAVTLTWARTSWGRPETGSKVK